MGNISSSKKDKHHVLPESLGNWDGLIAFAEENIRRNEVKADQLRALVRYFKARQEAGEECPTSVLAN